MGGGGAAEFAFQTRIGTKDPWLARLTVCGVTRVGFEIPVEAIVGLDGSEAMTAEQHMNQLHTAGFGLFCEICIAGRDIA